MPDQDFVTRCLPHEELVRTLEPIAAAPANRATGTEA